MKSKMSLLPQMAVNNIRKNGSTYFPYIGVSVFAMFTYFVFDLILKNDIMHSLPKAAYAIVLVTIGFGLLGVIMVPFLYYTNSFLIKRRKKELGLYSILGMEKKHIGIMMFWESLMLYGIVMTGAIVLGLLFSKLIFLLLLNLTGLPVEADFSISPRAILDTLVFYAFVTGLNLFVNLVQVGKARPVELMSESKKGEKEPKHIGLMTVLGLLLLGWGYYLAISSSLDSMIFMNFFLAVFLVILGTYFLFTSGSIALLRFLKKRKKYYYRADNFVTVSGMLYRMKKNAASLSNICVFGTMVMITVICTLSVWMCTDSIIGLFYPRTFQVTFLGKQDETAFQTELESIADKNGVVLDDYLSYCYVKVPVYKENHLFRACREEDKYDYANQYSIKLTDLDAYNRMEGADMTLEPGEALVFATGSDWGYDKLLFGEYEYRVKEELMQCKVQRKAPRDEFNCWYLAVLPTEEDVNRVAEVFGVNAAESRVTEITANPMGESEAVDAFRQETEERFMGSENYAGCMDYREDIQDLEGMYGGLLFIGIFYGAIFLVCLLIIMYYKQITEGFEDQKNFEIMQKVGMSDEEIRKTIRKQILLVFALPLAGALLHTLVGMKMVIVLMAAIRCVEVPLMLGCTTAVCVVFAVLYSICYKRTSATYYRIVKQMG